MRTITNERVVGREPDYSSSAEKGRHFAQVRRGSHIPAALYVGKNRSPD